MQKSYYQNPFNKPKFKNKGFQDISNNHNNNNISNEQCGIELSEKDSINIQFPTNDTISKENINFQNTREKKCYTPSLENNFSEYLVKSKNKYAANFLETIKKLISEKQVISYEESKSGNSSNSLINNFILLVLEFLNKTHNDEEMQYIDN